MKFFCTCYRKSPQANYKVITLGFGVTYLKHNLGIHPEGTRNYNQHSLSGQTLSQAILESSV
jgi:hypothetical protein